MDKLGAMALFVRVVETGAVSRAADSLDMPKATASTWLQQLENQLGVKLLNRTTRRIHLTADGAAYYERCVAILDQVREAEEGLTQQHAAPRGRLRVDVPSLMARSVFVPALPGFFHRYPSIELALASSERSADLLEEGIDCAVRSGDIEQPQLVARRVGFLYFATCASPSYLSAHGRPSHPSDLQDHRCIHRFSARSGEWADWLFSRNGERFRATPPQRVAFEDENSYVAAAEAGLGIAQIPAFVLKDAMERGTLDIVLGDWFPEPAPIHVVYPQNRHLSAKVRAFVDWVAEVLREHDGIQLRSTLRRA